MKYLILLNLCLLSYVGCANKHNRQNDTTNKIQSLSDSCKLLGKDPLSNYCSAIDTNVIHEQEYVIDTVAGDFIYIVVLKIIRISYLLRTISMQIGRLS